MGRAGSVAGARRDFVRVARWEGWRRGRAEGESKDGYLVVAWETVGMAATEGGMGSVVAGAALGWAGRFFLLFTNCAVRMAVYAEVRGGKRRQMGKGSTHERSAVWGEAGRGELSFAGAEPAVARELSSGGPLDTAFETPAAPLPASGVWP